MAYMLNCTGEFTQTWPSTHSYRTVTYSQCVVSNQFIIKGFLLVSCMHCSCKHSLSRSQVSQSTSPKFPSFSANVITLIEQLLLYWLHLKSLLYTLPAMVMKVYCTEYIRYFVWVLLLCGSVCRWSGDTDLQCTGCCLSWGGGDPHMHCDRRDFPGVEQCSNQP